MHDLQLYKMQFNTDTEYKNVGLSGLYNQQRAEQESGYCYIMRM